MFYLAFIPIAIESIHHDYYNITKNVPLYIYRKLPAEMYRARMVFCSRGKQLMFPLYRCFTAVNSSSFPFFRGFTAVKFPEQDSSLINMYTLLIVRYTFIYYL